MEITPISWFPVKVKNDKSYIYCFTDNGLIIKFPAISLSLLQFASELPESNFWDKRVQIANFNLDDLSNESKNDKESLVTWIEAKCNIPLLDAFFASMSITPYANLQITNYIESLKSNKILETSYVMLSDTNQKNMNININRLFYSFLDNETIDVLIDVNKTITHLRYVIGKIPTANNVKVFADIDLLLEAFFFLITTHNISRIYCYNIHIVKKLSLKIRNKLPNISKLSWLPPLIYEKKVATNFGEMMIEKIKIIGVEQIDIYKFMKRFYPGLSSYDIETINSFYSNSFDSSIKSRDANSAEVLYELFKLLSIDDNLEKLANITGVCIEDLLDLSTKDLVKKMMFRIDPTTSFADKGWKEPKVKCITPGLYNDVYVYDYSELYLISMRNSKDNITKMLADLISDTPPEFISTVYHSEFVKLDSDEVMTKLDEIIGRKDVIEISSYTLKVIGDNLANWVRKLSHYPGYLVLSHDSYIICDDLGHISVYGLNEICHPPFLAASIYIGDLLSYIFGLVDDNSEPKIPDVKEVEMGLINKEYVYTINGMTNINEYTGTTLDRAWYRKKLLGYREILLPFFS